MPKAKKKLKFSIIGYADISTGYLDPADLDLIGPGSPCHIFEHDDGYGSIFYLPADRKDEVIQEWVDYGLSSRFIAIMTALLDQEVQYVRFDNDGGDIDGMEYHPDHA